MVKPGILKQAQAATEETRKMALERRVLPEIRSVFSQMVTEYVAEVTDTGSVPNAAEFQGEWEATFLRHYRRVGRSFLTNQRRSKFYEAMTCCKAKLSPEQNQSLVSVFSRWSRGFGKQQAELVTETNQKDYVTALQRANEDLPGASPAVVAARAGVLLRQLFRARDTSIANVQTQAPAEEAKKDEAVALNAADGKQEDELEKTWQTVGDADVRIAHVAANGQVQTGNTAFAVGGESLRYPGDSTLGASAGNVINCRCAAIWT